jgi:hypothetical protein
MNRLADGPSSKLNAELLANVKNFCDSHLQDDATLITVAVETVPAEKMNVSPLVTSTSNSELR